LIADGEQMMRSSIEAGSVKGVDRAGFDSAIYLPASNGTWVAMDIDGYTLLVYSATATVGGSIPEELMMQYLHSGLDTFILDGVKRAKNTVVEHYKAPHEPIYGGDGKPIPLFSR
jgi:hypothetical protein